MTSTSIKLRNKPTLVSPLLKCASNHLNQAYEMFNLSIKTLFTSIIALLATHSQLSPTFKKFGTTSNYLFSQAILQRCQSTKKSIKVKTKNLPSN